MDFSNVKVIVDSHKLMNDKILIKEAYCFCEPMDIQSVEDLEDNLIKCEIPYILAQVETVLVEPIRYKRGYALFVQLASLNAMTNRVNSGPKQVEDSEEGESL